MCIRGELLARARGAGARVEPGNILLWYSRLACAFSSELGGTGSPSSTQLEARGWWTLRALERAGATVWGYEWNCDEIRLTPRLRLLKLDAVQRRIRAEPLPSSFASDIDTLEAFLWEQFAADTASPEACEIFGRLPSFPWSTFLYAPQTRAPSDDFERPEVVGKLRVPPGFQG